MSYIRETEVLEKTVIAPDGKTLGVVREIAFSLDGKVGFVVAGEGHEERTIPLDEVQGVGDFVILKANGSEPSVELEAPVAGNGSPEASRSEEASGAGRPGASGPGACPSCGGRLKEGAQFCGGCGTPVQEGGS